MNLKFKMFMANEILANVRSKKHLNSRECSFMSHGRSINRSRKLQRLTSSAAATETIQFRTGWQLEESTPTAPQQQHNSERERLIQEYRIGHA